MYVIRWFAQEKAQSQSLQLVCSISSVCFRDLAEIACLNRCMLIIGCIILAFLQCVFLNAAPNYLFLRMQNHISCICFTFPHCVFSNVFSNCLPEQMQNHTGCTYQAFPHCEFSNVVSNRQHVQMQTHTGCICLTFLHCVFSNVSSNCLPQMM